MKSDKVQSNLEQAIGALARDLPAMAPKDACARLGWLKRQAVQAGAFPAAMVAAGLASAITLQGRNVPLKTWLDALAVAAGCGPEDSEAGPLLLATVGVRFAA
jgi:hypothetical protein